MENIVSYQGEESIVNHAMKQKDSSMQKVRTASVRKR